MPLCARRTVKLPVPQAHSAARQQLARCKANQPQIMSAPFEVVIKIIHHRIVYACKIIVHRFFYSVFVCKQPPIRPLRGQPGSSRLPAPAPQPASCAARYLSRSLSWRCKSLHSFTSPASLWPQRRRFMWIYSSSSSSPSSSSSSSSSLCGRRPCPTCAPSMCGLRYLSNTPLANDAYTRRDSAKPNSR